MQCINALSSSFCVPHLDQGARLYSIPDAATGTRVVIAGDDIDITVGVQATSKDRRTIDTNERDTATSHNTCTTAPTVGKYSC